MANLLATIKGSSMWATDHTGRLVSIVEQEGTYTIQTDSGMLELPQSYIATFEDGCKMNWPAWLDDAGVKHPWSLFDPSIDLVNDEVHIWRDEDKRFHVALA